jgi:hypothetical protein
MQLGRRGSLGSVPGVLTDEVVVVVRCGGGAGYDVYMFFGRVLRDRSVVCGWVYREQQVKWRTGECKIWLALKLSRHDIPLCTLSVLHLI